MWPTLFSIVLHVLNLIVLFFIVYKLVYNPVVKMLNSRLQSIDEKRTEAEQNNQEALLLQESYKAQLNTIDTQREQVRLQAVEEAANMSDGILEEARQKATALLEENKRDLEERKQNVVKENEKEIKDLALELAAEIVQRELSENDNQKIIDDFFAQSFQEAK